LDAGYFSATTIQALLDRGIAPYIATGRDPHHPSWQERFAAEPAPPPPDASLIVQMAYQLRTAIGKAVYGARKSTVEPVISIALTMPRLTRSFPISGSLTCDRAAMMFSSVSWSTMVKRSSFPALGGVGAASVPEQAADRCYLC